MNSANAALWGQFEGQSIENTYRLSRLIGVGGFAGVFEAEHVVEGRLIRRVAVKLIVADPEMMQRQLDELVAATMLHHPNVLRCFHAGSALIGRSKLLYLVMEIAAEGSLQGRLSKGVLPLSEVTAMTEQVTSALAHLHRQNLVHRDLKAANVLLVGGEWKVSDFGTIRKSAGTGPSHTKGIIGTVAYMPPESFEGTVSTAWDMWSLGIVILESLTGKRPFEAASEEQLIGAILHKSPAIPAGLPEPFDEIVRCCVARNDRERWSAQQVLDALKRSAAVKIRDLLAAAQRHREAGRWEDALKILREAQQLDAASSEIPRLIAETERQQKDEFLERQRVERLKRDISGALARNDIGLASRLMAELKGPSPMPAPAPGPPTLVERPPRKRSLWPWLIAATVTIIALSVAIWVALRPAPDSSKRDGNTPPTVSTPAEQSPQPQPPAQPAVDVEAHLKKAAQYHEQGMYDAAIAEYDAILKADPGNRRAKAGRARAVRAKEAEANVQK